MSADAGFEGLLEFVRDTRGFDFTGYRRPTLARRFEKRMQAVGAEDWGAYRAYLEGHADEFDSLFNTILINVTGFFRDRETWDVVAAGVLPRLLDSKGSKTAIRVWSAGCSSGEEPYTVLMLLAEAVGEEALKERVKIYATDVDDEALVQARDAAYTSKQLEHVPAELRERYFQPVDGRFAFRKDLRRLVIFGRNDLHYDPPISRVDLLVSRNTLMYFGPEVQERILANFHFALNRGGFLVVGRAEALQAGRRLFGAFDAKRRIFVKDGTAEPAFPRAPQLLPREDRAPGLAELREAAFEHAPFAQIVVGGDNRVAAINRPARTLFVLKLNDVGRPLQDLDVSYRPVDLRSLVNEVREKRRLLAAKDIRWETPGGDERWLDVQVSPLLEPGNDVAGVSVAFLDVTGHRALEANLETARRELETAYEELQSTVEELETTNEELQSTNEELETTNEELQSANEELETMNDELRERTDETVRVNSFLGSVLSGINQAVMVVDRDLRVIAWSRLAHDQWGLSDDEVEGKELLELDIGMPLEALREPLRHILSGEDPAGIALVGHNRRGQAVDYAVAFAPLVGELNGVVVGAIVLVSSERRPP